MAPCNPPLNFVANGAPGSAFPPPLDPTPPSFGPPSPTFEQDACSLLGPDLCGGMDPISAIDELDGLVTAIDELTTAADANLDAILLELDQLGQDKVNQAFDDFAGAQPGASSLLADVTGVAVPAIGTVPIVSPTGSTVVNIGAPPAQGGAAPAGAAAYTLHYPVSYLLGAPGAIDTSTLEGPDPPFVKLTGYEVVATPAGQRQVNALIEINPAHAGTFHATLKAKVIVRLTGITTPVDISIPITVVVQ